MPPFIGSVGVKRCSEDTYDFLSGQSVVKQGRIVDNTPRQQLEEIVAELTKHKDQLNFPQRCAEAFDSVIYQIIEANSSKGSLVLPKMVSAGKSLVMIINLAVLCKNLGLDHLQKARRQIDAERFANCRAPTRHWFGFVAEDKTNRVDTTTWETIKASIKQHPARQPVHGDTASIASLSDDDLTGGATTDEEIFSLPDYVVECFGQRHVLEPFNTKDLDDLFCDSCKFEPEELKYQACEECGMIYCDFCSERWAHFA
jgi:hypothetical protein